MSVSETVSAKAVDRMDVEALRGWIGRSETCEDRATRAPLNGLAALLDRAGGWGDVVPPLGHWLYFLPTARQSAIDVDGHPRRGGFLPPVPLPRRMWAGGRVEFIAPIPIDSPITRTSIILDVKHKKGGSGDLVFLVLRHEIAADGELAIVEEQDIVYRAAGGSAPPVASPPPPPRPADAQRRLVADATFLFRYSALTFNAHRIHYDRDYARDVEGYGGLVVHGPLLATLLAHHLVDHAGTPLRRFSFRGERPLLGPAPFDLCLAATNGGFDLWTRDAGGWTTMTAKAEVTGPAL